MACHGTITNHHSRISCWIAVFYFILFAAGCASIQSPSADVRSVSIKSIGADAVVLDLNVDLRNPNAIAIPLSTADYAINVGTSRLVDGTIQTIGTMPANGSLPVSIPISIGYQNLLDFSDVIRQSDGNLLYSLDGGISVGSSPLARKRVPIHYDSTLPLNEVAKNPKLLLSGGAGAQLARKILGGYFGHE